MTVSAILELKLTPESLDAAPAVISATLAQTRAFDGNLGVEVFVDSADATHYVVVEHWESAEHDAAYRQWRTTPEGASALGTIVAERPVLTKLEPTTL